MINLQLSRDLRVIGEAAYPRKKHQFGAWQPQEVRDFSGSDFDGFVACAGDKTVVAFRGSNLSFDSPENFTRTVRDWLVNFDYAQVVKNGAYRVHRGFDREIDSAFPKVREIIRSQRSDGRPLYLTGHSAGGGLATLAARRLFEGGTDVSGVYVFSSPRVGCSRFAASYPSGKLFRFEQRDDPVPHLPFPPSVAKIIGALGLDAFLTLVQKLCPELNPAAYGSSNVEYVHAGDLFYASDAANEFYYSGSEGFSAFAGSTLLKALDEGFSWLSGEKKSFDWFLPMPKEMLDGGRAIGTFATIMSHLATDRFDFLNDHGFAYLDQRFGRWLRS